MESKSEEKYKRLKKNLKKALNENEQLKYHSEGLMSKIEHYKRKIRFLKQERDMLIDRIQRYEPDSDSTINTQSDNEVSESESEDVVSEPEPEPEPEKQIIEEKPISPQKKRGKRRRANSIRRAQKVDTDENGKAILPIKLGVMTLHSLGTVVYDREAFHNERYIFPVGYSVTRRYFSMKKPEEYVNYRCTVRDGGKAPIFEVCPEDAPEKKTSASSPTGAWISIVRAVNELRNKEHGSSASGPDYFGFTSSTIAKLIQDLPNTRLCKNYKWQEFETTSGRSLKKTSLAVRKEALLRLEQENNGDDTSIAALSAKIKEEEEEQEKKLASARFRKNKLLKKESAEEVNGELSSTLSQVNEKDNENEAGGDAVESMIDNEDNTNNEMNIDINPDNSTKNVESSSPIPKGTNLADTYTNDEDEDDEIEEESTLSDVDEQSIPQQSSILTTDDSQITSEDEE